MGHLNYSSTAQGVGGTKSQSYPLLLASFSTAADLNAMELSIRSSPHGSRSLCYPLTLFSASSKTRNLPLTETNGFQSELHRSQPCASFCPPISCFWPQSFQTSVLGRPFGMPDILPTEALFASATESF